MKNESQNKKPKTAKQQKAEFRKRFVENDQSSTFSGWVKDWNFENSFFGLLGSKSEKFKISRILYCFLFSLVFSLLLTFEGSYNNGLKLGEIAEETVRSPFNFEVTDFEATQRKKEEAAKSVPKVFDYFPNQYEVDLDNIYSTFSNYRVKLRKSKIDPQNFKTQEKEAFQDSLGVKLNDRTFSWLVDLKFDFKIEQALTSIIEKWSTSFLIDAAKENDKKISVRTIGSKGDIVLEEKLISDAFLTPITSYKSIDHDFTTFSNKYDKKKLASIARQLRKPNLLLNPQVSSQRVNDAVTKVLPVVIPVKENQVILTEGSLIQDQDILLVNEINNKLSSTQQQTKFIILTFILSILLLTGVSLLKHSFGFKMDESRQDLIILGAITILGVLLIRCCIFLFEGALVGKFNEQVPLLAVLVMAPYAMCSMLATMLIKSKKLIWFYIIYASLGLSFLASDKFSFFILLSVGGIAAVRTFETCKSRKDFYFAGFITGLIIGVSAIFVHLLAVDSILNVKPVTLGWLFGAGVIGGFLSAIFTVTLIPLFESVFDVMTDLKLLELSSLSHPLLKDLMVKAPGTYHHCVVVGSMVEAAAIEIGVNGLLGKVMAYFHDVGKMNHADYFIENQRKGKNPHDTISAHLSKTIIIAHVKDGAEMVLKHKLGKSIFSGVIEHHGTTLISYFYNKAKKDAQDEKEIKEEEFRYSGPKPQFKESAILMLADSIEAAARTLDEPSPLRIQNLIDSMVESKFTDGQLNECNITFEELTKIKKSFYRVLVGVYHHRVEYPGTNKPKGDRRSVGGNAEKAQKTEKAENTENSKQRIEKQPDNRNKEAF